MDLSNALKKQFAKVTKKETPKVDTPLYGTAHVMEGAPIQVILDGSSIQTPSISVVDVQDGDRVTCHIRNHKLIIDGNVSRPTDSALDEVAELQDELDNLDFTTLVQIVDEYCLATENYIPEGETFEDIRYTEWTEDITEIEWEPGYYFWHRQKYIFSDDSITYSDPWFDATIQITYEAERIAKDAQQGVDDATDIAEAANTVANQKRRVFNSTPTPPYDLNDMWFDGPQGEAKICIRAKTENQSYAASDWQLATKYTDDSTVNALKNHFWYDSSGAHVAQTQGDVTTGYAQTIASTGITQTYNGKLISSWTNSTLNFYDSSGSSPVLLASYTKSGASLYANGYQMMALSPSGLSLYKSNNGGLMAGFLSTGITFANDIPFTIGNSNSYIKWVKENNTWKIKIAADEIEMGGTGVKTVTGSSVSYASSSSATTVPSSFPYTSPPTVSQGNYLWTKTTITYSDGSSTTSYSVARQGRNGADGNDGNDGNDGTSVWITSTQVRYASSSSATSTPSSFSYSSPPTVSQGYYLWTRTVVNYSDGSSTTSYSVARQGVDGSDGEDITSRYVTYISSTYGVRVYSSSGQPNTYAQVNSSAISMVTGGTTYASFGSTCTIGSTSYHNIRVTSSSIDFYSGTTARGSLYSGTITSRGGSGSQNAIILQNYGYDCFLGIGTSYIRMTTPTSSSQSSEIWMTQSSMRLATWNRSGTRIGFQISNDGSIYTDNADIVLNNAKRICGLLTDGTVAHLLQMSGSNNCVLNYDGWSNSASDLNGYGYNSSLIAKNHARLQVYNTSPSYSSYVHYLRDSDPKFMFRPSATDTVYLGSASYRWKYVYAQYTTIQTSDLKYKNVLTDFDWKVDEFIKGLNPIAYKHKYENGVGESDRIYLGFGAQEVSKLVKDLGIGNLGMYQANIKGYNSDGDPEDIPYHGEDIDDQYLTWSLGYTEFIAPIVLELQRLMKRVEDLERSTAL